MIEVKQRNVRQLYNLPEKAAFCKLCTMSNQRPRISFDAEGVCSACRYRVYKGQVDWAQREKELVTLLDQHRRHDGAYDVIVPCSGGKDGSFVAHQLKYVYGMHPLCVTWAPCLYTDTGRRNLESFIQHGFDHILGTANGSVYRLMTRLSFIHMAEPFQPFIYGQTNFPLRMAVYHKIPLIMYGENGEVEYGGDMKNAYRPTREISDHVDHYFSGIPPDEWQRHGISNKDLHCYLPPDFQEIKKAGIEIHFFSYYKFWDPQENYYYACENTGFQANMERTEGTYSKYASLDDKLDGHHYYLGFIKFGIGRATSDSAHEIRDGKITRDEGLALVKKFDGEFPARYHKDFLEYTNVTNEEFTRVVDSWRSDYIWKQVHDEWKLRHAVWAEP